jgi:deoxyadenosine/deoxycytidine kinase
MFWKIAEWVGCIRTNNAEEQTNTREMGSVKHKRESKKEQKEKVLLCVEGNISSGKSTTVNELRKVFDSDSRVKFLLEPLPIWEGIRDKDGNNMITKFYGNIKQYAFAFQMMAYISRLDILREALRDPDVDVIVTERSLFTDRNVFAKMLYDDNMLEDVEHTIYLKWFDSFVRDIPEMKIFYIKTSPEVAMQRLLSRNREGENVSSEYLERVHNYHEQWLNDNPFVVAIDGNSDIDSDDRPSKVIESVIKQELLSSVAEV